MKLEVSQVFVLWTSVSHLSIQNTLELKRQLFNYVSNIVSRSGHHIYKYNSISAVAEIGDRLATIEENQWGGRAGSPSNSVTCAEPTFVPSGILMHPAIWPQ